MFWIVTWPTLQSHRLRDKRRFPSKIANFSQHRVLYNSPRWNWVSAYRAPQSFNPALSENYYAALLPRRGPHIASHSVCPSVCLSVCPSVRPSRCRYRASRRAPSELQWHTQLFGTRWGPHIVRPSRPHKFLFILQNYAEPY